MEGVADMRRREFLNWTIKAGALAMFPTVWAGCQRGSGSAPIQLPALPYAQDALAPHISARTIGFHYGKHHQGYVNKVNTLIKNTPLAGIHLDELVQKTVGNDDATAVFNNAAQVFNHTFYWNSMKPGGGGHPDGKLSAQIDAAFGGYDDFRKAFIDAATGQFGSGWAWLVLKDETLAVIATGNADTPVAHGMKPILVVDVWEHAYYLDYQNQRKAYVEAFLDHLANWEFAEQNLLA
jgi:Fe-Mn family superoxide dismutase